MQVGGDVDVVCVTAIRSQKFADEVIALSETAEPEPQRYAIAHTVPIPFGGEFTRPFGSVFV